MADPKRKDDKMTDDTNMILTPDAQDNQTFTDAAAAVARLQHLYSQATEFLIGHFTNTVTMGKPQTRIRAFYPEIRLTVTSHNRIDSRLSFGHVSGPGTYSTTITRPDLFKNYLTQQIGLLMENHNVPVQIGLSDTPIPVTKQSIYDHNQPHELSKRYIQSDIKRMLPYNGDTWAMELCCVGIPQLTLPTQQAHVWNAKRLDDEGAGTFLGAAADVTVGQLAEAVAIVLDDPMERRGMTRCGRNLIDGRGGDRLVNGMEIVLHTRRESVPMAVPPLRLAA